MSELDAATVRRLLNYDQSTGVLTWAVDTGTNRAKAGKIAGTECLGYRVIRINRKGYKAHRLAWLHTHGAWPTGVIDHIDGNPLNNALSNLRDVTPAMNQHNRKRADAGSKTGQLGVYASPTYGKFYSSIVVGGVKHYLGTFDDAGSAHDAYMAKKAEIHTGYVA
jgi:hypothetical protein